MLAYFQVPLTEVAAISRDQLAQLWQSRHGGLLTFGFIAALWSSSAALVALIDTLDRVYDVEDSLRLVQARNLRTG